MSDITVVTPKQKVRDFYVRNARKVDYLAVGTLSLLSAYLLGKTHGKKTFLVEMNVQSLDDDGHVVTTPVPLIMES